MTFQPKTGLLWLPVKEVEIEPEVGGIFCLLHVLV